METATIAPDSFVDRRDHEAPSDRSQGERRQFGNSYDELSPDARELALLVDEYKLRHHRRFITFEELIDVIRSLGYRKSS